MFRMAGVSVRIGSGAGWGKAEVKEFGVQELKSERNPRPTLSNQGWGARRSNGVGNVSNGGDANSNWQ